MSPLIQVLIFSKDRAMQVDGVLRSFFLHCLDAHICKVHVIYKSSTFQHAKQYRELSQENSFRTVEWVEEKDFRHQVMEFLWSALDQEISRWDCLLSLPARLARIPTRYTGVIPFPNCKQKILFLVDDNLFVHDFSIERCALTLDAHTDALGYSLRLGRNTTYCYTQKIDQKLPEFTELSGDTLKFSWVGADKDFAYPLEISSSLYRLSEMVELISRLRFRNPNELESSMFVRRIAYMRKRSMLLCSEQSITFCNPVNIVNTVIQNIAGEHISYSSNQLADLYEKGYRIDIKSYSGFVPIGCHQEMPLKFSQ